MDTSLGILDHWVPRGTRVEIGGIHQGPMRCLDSDKRDAGKGKWKWK